MSQNHLTDEALLILTSRRCSDTLREFATAHLRECESCREKLKDTLQVQSAFAHIADQGLLKNESGISRMKPLPVFVATTFPWKPTLVILGICLAGFIFLTTSQMTTAANATTILRTSTQNDVKAGLIDAFRMDVSGVVCSRGTVLAEFSDGGLPPSCSHAVSLVHSASWPTQNPLSARAFATWRDSLADKRDAITRKSDSVKVKTVASSGLLREASLTMRSTDYHPVSLDLVFENEEEIIFTAETSGPPTEAASAQPKDIAPSRDVMTSPANPLDAAEVDAWALLDQLNANTGWEATVVRQGDQLEIKAFEKDSAREQQLRDALQHDPAVKLDVLGPLESTGGDGLVARRQLGGNSPALAHGWLEQQFPDVEERGKFSNGALELSKVILGRSFYLEQLEKSRSRMTPSPSQQHLSELIAHQKTLLTSSQVALAAAIQPLIGKPTRSTARPLTYAEAEHLDNALGALLATSTTDDPAYETQVETVRGLL